MGPGPLGAPGPRCRIRVVHVTTYCQASYLLTGKLPTVRQAISRMKLAPNNRRHAPKRFRIQTTYCQAKLPTVRQATYYQASYLLSGMHPNVAADFAPNNRIHAPNRSIDMHPKGIDMHPKVSIDFAPNNRILS